MNLKDIRQLSLEKPTEDNAEKLSFALINASDDVFWQGLYFFINSPNNKEWAYSLKKAPSGEKLLARSKKAIAHINKIYFSINPEETSEQKADCPPLTAEQLKRLDDSDLAHLKRRHDVMHGMSIWQREPSKYIIALLNKVKELKEELNDYSLVYKE